MSISFCCDRCGKPFNVPDELAGKAAKCKQCGRRLTIPAASADPGASPSFLDDLDAPPPLPRSAAHEGEALPPRARPTPQAAPRPKPSKPASAAQDSSDSRTPLVKNVVAGFLLLGLLSTFYREYRKLRGPEQPAIPQPAFAASTVPGPTPAIPSAAANAQAPMDLPPFPELGLGTEYEPGVMLYEARLPGGQKPGFSGKIWVYLPSGEHAPKSLPCVMITGAGSNLITGMELGDGDVPEHLPYVRAGFAVLAYELDGMLQNRTSINEAELGVCMNKFLAAKSGLVNAHIAIEFLLAKVPQVDPERIYTVGHSSAGTMALLFAEHEPRLKGCVAFAPAVDLEKRFGPEGVQGLRQSGFADLLTTYSPKQNEAKFQCPVLLFHASDDSNVPVSESEECARRLEQLGKPVTLKVVPTGDHYQSMLQQGIPYAIAWLQEKAGMAKTTQATPPQATQPTPPPNPNAFPGQRAANYITIPNFERPRPPMMPGRMMRGPRIRSPRFQRFPR